MIEALYQKWKALNAALQHYEDDRDSAEYRRAAESALSTFRGELIFFYEHYYTREIAPDDPHWAMRTQDVFAGISGILPPFREMGLITGLLPTGHDELPAVAPTTMIGVFEENPTAAPDLGELIDRLIEVELIFPPTEPPDTEPPSPTIPVEAPYNANVTCPVDPPLRLKQW